MKNAGRSWSCSMHSRSLGICAFFEEVPPVSRSADIWFVMVIQDLEQLWSTYGHDTPLWGNLGVQVFHAPNNDATAKRISKCSGPSTITVESVTQGMAGESDTAPDGAAPHDSSRGARDGPRHDGGVGARVCPSAETHEGAVLQG